MVNNYECDCIETFSVAPSVRVIMSADTVVEDSDQDLVLQCHLDHGNPAHMTSVQWYKDNSPLTGPPFVTCDTELELSDELFAELDSTPEDHKCQGETRVTLVMVDRLDTGHYSCQAEKINTEKSHTLSLNLSTKMAF